MPRRIGYYMLILDLFLRFSSVTMLMMIAVLCIRDIRTLKPARIAVFLTICISAILLKTTPEPFAPTGMSQNILAILCAPASALTWIFGLYLFDQSRTIPWPVWAIAAVHTVMSAICHFSGMAGPIGAFTDAIGAGMMLHLMYVILKDRPDDLVETRRTGRIYFLMCIAVSTLAVTVFGMIFTGEMAKYVPTFKLIAIFPTTVWAVLWFTSAREEGFSFEAAPAKPAAAPAPVIDPRDAALHAELIALFDAENIHTDAGLTVRSLAERLETPEHRLRALINQGMGYKNFSAFLNERRVRDVKAAFADPAHSRTPILTLAMDAGYNSLAPFNRAFRLLEGVTPSKYRQNLYSQAE